MNEDQQSTNYDRPVAYDADGRPLYARPVEAKPVNGTNGTQVVYMSRPIEPEKPVISEATKQKHDRSKQLYPNLNLSNGEYVISAVRRHPVGLVIPSIIGIILIAFALSALFNYDLVVQFLQLGGRAPSFLAVSVVVVIFVAFVLLAVYIAYYIYTNNRFFLTNESVIQEIQTGLFSKLEQTVSLSNIEDASFTQIGIVQQVLNYGSIRLSTEGDETTYKFSYVANPKYHIAILNNAVEAFQNGRPVDN